MAAARAAGALIDRADRSLRRQVRHKGAVDLVTTTDLACEEAIRAVLERETPGIPVFAEEGGGSAAATRWIVDPLDGTTNFVHGYPQVAVTVALQDGGRILAGCTWDAVRHRMFHATAGGGAFCDGERLAVSEVGDLEQALVVTGFPCDRRQKASYYLEFVRVFMERAQAFRRSGSAAMDLAMLASGQSDLYWEPGLKPWDMAAGVLLVAEAGGRVTAMDGGPFDLEAGSLAASNGLLQDAMLAVLREVQAGLATSRVGP